MGDWLAVDFGTSNSASAFFGENGIQRIQLEGGSETCPSSVFFSFEERNMQVGTVANLALIDGLEGRYMRSLKRVLGTSLMSESRMLIGRRMDFFDIISSYLRILRERSEEQTGKIFDKVVAGRPVYFDSKNAEKDTRAAKDLERCLKMAGFNDVEFVAEPEAAASSVETIIGIGDVGLVVDIGGGTSDFTVFKSTSKGIEILASNGIRIGGTDLDSAINLNLIMPLLGYRQEIKNVISGSVLPAPNWVYSELSTWEKIPFLYNQKTRQFAVNLARDAVEPSSFKRLLQVIDMQLGHEIAFVSEEAKIQVNGPEAEAKINLGFLEAGLEKRVKSSDFQPIYQPFQEELVEGIAATIEKARLENTSVSHVVPVGGSSLMRPVRQAISQLVPNAQIVDAPVFTAIVDGLALRCKHMNGQG